MSDVVNRGSAAVQDAAKPALRPLWQTLSLIGLLLFCSATFTALGIWQMHRLAWKQDLIATVDARVHAEPVPIPAPSTWDGLDVESLAYQRVQLSGVFDHEAESQALAVTELGGGYWVMTPLNLEDGGVVLVNRGYVPQELREPSSRPDGAPQGRVQVTGLLRVSEPGGGFLRDNDPINGRWYSRDTAAMADAHAVTGRVAPFFVDVEADGVVSILSSWTMNDDAEPEGVAAVPTTSTAGETDGDTGERLLAMADYPLAGLTVISFRNTHLSYALTWFTLAVLSFAAVALVVRDRRPRRSPAR